MEKILFSEEQRFTQWWLWLIILLSLSAIVLPFAIGIHSQLVLDQPYGYNPMSTEGLIVTGFFSVALMGFIFFIIGRARLKTKITNEALFVSFMPLSRKWKKYTPDEIDRFEIRTYKAKREYGGYGIKRRRRSGQAYTISGNTGLQLYLRRVKRY